jgi:hypothetical protein
MRAMRNFFVVLGVVVGVGVAACGNGELGESCDTEGVQGGECDEGLVCGKHTSTSNDLTCLKQCSSQAECAADESCSGTAGGSLKGCRKSQ